MADIKGMRFGRLIAVCSAPRRCDKRHWECLCDCGKVTSVNERSLTSGATNSCGCLRKEVSAARATKHGHKLDGTTKTYTAWQGMKDRCYNRKCIGFPNYGGRGITVCKQWHKFENFLTDMGEAPPGMSLDRKNNDQGYSKANCRWATRQEQNSNTRRNNMVEYGGCARTLSEWARLAGISTSLLAYRVRRGWSMGKALSPADKCRSKGGV